MTVNGLYVTFTASMLLVAEPLTGLFLCAELDQAVLSATVFQFGSNPIKATGDPTAIIGVLV